MQAEIVSQQGTLWGIQPGDRRWVHAESFEVDSDLGEGQPALLVRAVETRDTGSPRREQWTEATLTLRLDQQDLQRLFERAIQEGLVQVPGHEVIEEAIRLLQCALTGTPPTGS